MTDQFIAEFEEEKRKIQSDSNLSQQGQRAKIDKLTNEKTGEARQLIKVWRQSTVKAALALRDAQRDRERLEKEAKDNLDYERLNYERAAMQSSLDAAGGNPAVIRQAWEETKKSGDMYKIKVWTETGPGAIKKLGGTDHSGQRDAVLKDLESVEPELIKAPEVTELELTALHELQDAERAAKALDATFGKGQGGVVGRVFNGISFEGNKVNLDFEQQTLDKPWGPEIEKAEAVYKRLEADHEDHAEAVNELAKKFGTMLDPDFDNMSA